MSLSHLLAEAASLAGGNLCTSGHQWECIGGRPCPKGQSDCSQSVMQCSRCGQYDYGEPGGPGYIECRLDCKR